METGWRSSSSEGVGTGDSGGQNSNFTHSTWNNWDISTPAVTSTHFYNWTNPASSVTTTVAAEETGLVHAYLLNSTSGVQSNCMAHDPHMMCLKLGKRHYCEDTAAESYSAAARKGKPVYPFQYPNPYNSATVSPGVRVTSLASGVPRCQVEGCHVALGNVKEYYRKHKVCEVHSKAPKVVVSGLQQRFCQQCSRFHGVTEFDEAKRSCRRRLKGHNQRRRKGTHSMMEQQLGPSNPGCALSLLSSPSPETQNSNPSSDLSSRCSAALYELIAANRATSSSSVLLNQSIALGDTQMWDDTTTTSDMIKQGPALEFGLLSMKSKDPEAEGWTDYCWSSFGGANLM